MFSCRMDLTFLCLGLFPALVEVPSASLDKCAPSFPKDRKNKALKFRFQLLGSLGGASAKNHPLRAHPQQPSLQSCHILSHFQLCPHLPMRLHCAEGPSP